VTIFSPLFLPFFLASPECSYSIQHVFVSRLLKKLSEPLRKLMNGWVASPHGNIVCGLKMNDSAAIERREDKKNIWLAVTQKRGAVHLQCW
jgi:hypothetical protein